MPSINVRKRPEGMISYKSKNTREKRVPQKYPILYFNASQTCQTKSTLYPIKTTQPNSTNTQPTKPNSLNQTLLPYPHTKSNQLIQIYQVKLTKPNIPSQTLQIQPTKLPKLQRSNSQTKLSKVEL